MLHRKNKKSSSRRSAQARTDSTFRRNNVVISRSQREVAAHKQSVSQRQADHKRSVEVRVWKKRLVLGAVLAILFVLGARMQFTNVQIGNSQSVRVSENQNKLYRVYVQDYVNSNVPLKQSWLFDKQAASNSFKREFPEVKSVTFRSRSLISTTLVMEIEYRKPIYTWTSLGEKHFVDKEGVLFTKNMYNALDLSKLPFIEDQGGAAAKDGQRVLTASVVEQIAAIYSSLPPLFGKEARVEKVVLPTATREIQVYIAGLPYRIKMSTERAIEDQTGELRQIVGYLNAGGTVPAEYVDIRVANKVFYK